MKILPHSLKLLFATATCIAYPDLEKNSVLEKITVEDPRDIGHGDYASPLAFGLAKMTGKHPEMLAKEIVSHFPADHRVGSVEFAKPGYINLRLKTSFLEECLKELESGFQVERAENVRTEPVIIEYSSTNAAKPMGVHHLITTILGDSLANLFEFMGYETIRINHLGDWGTQFGKLIYAVEEWGDKSEIARHPNEEFMRLYVKFNELAEKDPTLDDKARNIFKELEEGDELRLAMWEWIVMESTKDLERQLARLGIHFTHIMGESFYRKMSEEVIEDGLKKKIFVEGENGALIFDMGEDQTPALIRKGDGTTLYLTRDVATVKYRVDTWHPSAILYVVDHAQSLHFKQDFAVSKALDYARGTDLEHISFGRMRFKDRSMSSRKGNVVIMEELLDTAEKRAALLAAEKGTDMPRADLKKMSEIVGTSSVKYAILSQERNKDIIFDWGKIITLEGNSAAYLLYTYARAHSIIEKTGPAILKDMPKLTLEVEMAMVRQMIKFPEVLEKSLEERKPHMISGFLYDLCQNFNRFYNSAPVITAKTDLERRTRLGIIQAFLHEMKTGLTILGIPVLEKM